MAIRIRVYPQNGMLGMNGLGMNGLGMNRMGAVSAQTYFNSRLQTQKQVSNLQLGYERALASERIDKARLEERMKNPFAMAQVNPYAQLSPYGQVNPYAQMNPYGMSQAYNPYAASMLGTSMLGSSNFFGSLGLGGMF